MKLVYTYCDEVRYKTIEFMIIIIKLKMRNKLGKFSLNNWSATNLFI